jgi:hypothetical protein
METIREATAAAEPTHDERPPSGSPSTETPAATQEPRERDLALRIRMAASSLAGIALMHRDRDPGPSR